MAEWKRQETKKVEGIGGTRLSKWERLEQNYIKVNCDAAYDVNTSNGGWGCVLHDADGDAISVYCRRVESLMSALHGELIASIHGAQATADKGVGHVILETDALEVVQAVYSDAFDLSAVTFLVGELRCLLEFNFISWRVQQRPRSCNRVAHELAILGSFCDLDEDSVLTSLPAHVYHVLAEDSAMSR
jgi:hypothetical protein